MLLVQNDPTKILIANVPQLISNLRPTYEKLLTRRKIPDQLTSSAIRPEYFPGIIELHLSLFKLDPAEIEARLSGRSSEVNYCQKTSTLLLLENDVIGVTIVLSKKNHKLAFVYAVIVSAPWRRTWAAASLKYHSCRRLLSNGFDEIAFQAYEGNPDTSNYARKAGAKLVVDNYVWHD